MAFLNKNLDIVDFNITDTAKYRLLSGFFNIKYFDVIDFEVDYNVPDSIKNIADLYVKGSEGFDNCYIGEYFIDEYFFKIPIFESSGIETIDQGIYDYSIIGDNVYDKLVNLKIMFNGINISGSSINDDIDNLNIVELYDKQEFTLQFIIENSDYFNDNIDLNIEIEEIDDNNTKNLFYINKEDNDNGYIMFYNENYEQLMLVNDVTIKIKNQALNKSNIAKGLYKWKIK